MAENLTNKRKKSAISIYAIILILYVVAFIVIPFSKSVSSWVCFGFTVISIVLSLASCGYAFNKSGAENAIYGFPIFKIGLINMIAQILFGIIICIVSAFVAVPYWVAVLVSVLMIGVAIIGIIFADNARDTVVEVGNKTEESIKPLAMFNIDISGVIDICESEELKPKLMAIEKTLKYSSDPVSSEATAKIEEKIQLLLNDLKTHMEAGQFDDADVLIKKLSNAINERNRICKSSKK